MTEFEKIEHLYQGHNCSNCGATCDHRNEICEKWKKEMPIRGHTHQVGSTGLSYTGTSYTTTSSITDNSLKSTLEDAIKIIRSYV